MPQCFANGVFLFGRALRNNLVFLLGQIIVVAGGETKLALGLGDLEAGDLEAVGFQDVVLDLLVGSFGLGGSEIGVL